MMKTKNIVYHNDTILMPNNISLNTSIPHNQENSPNRKTISINKNRETSAHKYHQNITNNISRMHNVDKNGQKVKVLVSPDGFIIEKKSMLYDIQCIFTQINLLNGEIIIPPLCFFENPATSFPSSVPQPQERIDNSNLILNLEANTIGVTQNSVRQNFSILNESCGYIQIKMSGYTLENILIQGKKVETVKFVDNHVIDEQDVTIIWPIKLIEEAQISRENKLRRHFEKTHSSPEFNNKSYDFFWSSQTESIDQFIKNHNKRPEPEWAELFKLNPSTPTTQTIQRERSSYKLNTSYGEKIFKENNNKSSRDSLKKFQLMDLMKSKEILNKNKIERKPNDSGIYATSKNAKENISREDVYGLENLQEPKIKTKAHKNSRGAPF